MFKCVRKCQKKPFSTPTDEFWKHIGTYCMYVYEGTRSCKWERFRRQCEQFPLFLVKFISVFILFACNCLHTQLCQSEAVCVLD